MEPEVSDAPVDESQKIDARITAINVIDSTVKASYNELRTMYSVICNDIKAAIFKRLALTVADLRRLAAESFSPKSIKKDAYLQQVVKSLQDLLEGTPDLNPQNLEATIYFVRDVVPILIRLKARYTKNLKLEKKVKKIREQQNLVFNLNHVCMELHTLSNILNDYQYFDNFALTLIRGRYNKDDINKVIREIQEIVKKFLRTGKNEIIDINKLRLVNHLTIRIIIRLSIYEFSGLYMTFSRILKGLPGQLVQQFNVRYAARKRDKQEVTAEVKKSEAYLNITKKFVTLKLEKFYELQNAYQLNMSKLFQLDKQTNAEFDNLLLRMEGIRNPDTRQQMIDKFHDSIIDKLDIHNWIVKAPGKDEDYTNLSLRNQFAALISYYYNVLKDIVAPQKQRDLVVKYVKQLKPPRDLYPTGNELKLLAHQTFARREDLLKIYLDGILDLVVGKENDDELIESLLEAIKVETRSMRSEDMKQRTIQEFVEIVTPAELDLLLQIFGVLPTDRKRLGTALGSVYMEVVQKYPDYIKRKIDRLEKIQPTDSDIEKLKKSTTEKVDRLFFKAVGHQSEKPAPITVLQSKLEEEKNNLEAVENQYDLVLRHEVNSLLGFWSLETDRSVVDFCLGNANKVFPTTKINKMNKVDLKNISSKFNSDYLQEIEKHYKTLNESIGTDYLKHKKPYFSLEHILLFASRTLLMGFRAPEKTYPRLYERMSAVFGKKK